MSKNMETFIFPPHENPAKKLLESTNIPKNYEGSSTSQLLTQLFNTAVKTGNTKNLHQISMEQYGMSDDETLYFFTARVLRFNPTVSVNTVKNIYWNLKKIIDMNNPTFHYQIAENYQTVQQVFPNIVPDLSIFYKTLFEEQHRINKTVTTVAPVAGEKIVNFILLNKSLREEGIVLPVRETIACSARWEQKEIFTILQQGTKLSEAIKLYDIGFKTVEEIVNYAETIPETWIDLILE